MGSVPLTGKVVRVRPTFPFAEKQYARKIERSGFKAIICYGIAFYRKECLVGSGQETVLCLVLPLSCVNIWLNLI